MQNVGQETVADNQKLDKVVNAHEIGKSSSTPQSSNSSPTKSDTDPYSEINPRFLSDSSESEDEEISEVDSFVIDQVADIDENEARLQPSKFLLAQEDPDHTVDPETQARLEALLEAAGIGKLATADGKQLADPDVLRRLTSSVSCALDEAAAALTRMRSENPRPQPERSLVEACSDGDVGTVRKLLGEGRSVHETTEEGESLLSLACSAGYYELAQVLLAMHANVEDRGIKGDCTPLMEAASSGYVDIVRLLIHHGADVNAQSSSACAGNTPLMYACAGGHVEAVRVLLDAGANVEDHNENGHTPLMEAASAGHVPVAELLLERGAGINTHSNEFKESALTLACYKGHLDMVRFLLEAGADQEHKTDEMHTALMEASMDGHVEVARLLLDSGAQVNMPTDSFESPLTLAACGGHVHLALLLIERGANIEEVNDEGYTPLMEAAREGHEDMVAVLLEKGANINAQTEETQETALTLACCGGFLEVANFLIKNGAEIELGASTPLMEAAQEGHLELVRYLLEANADVNAQTQTGDTALTYSCENGHTEVARLLLQYGADLEHESEGGRTPLMKACRAGHICTVKFLLSQNANVNKQTANNDHTPLSLAAAGGHIAVVELLLSQSANPFHKLKDNSTMLIEAAKGGHTNVVQLLLDYPHSIMMRGSEQNGSTSAAAPPPTTTASSSSISSSTSSSSSGLHDVPDAVRALPPEHIEPKPPALNGRMNDQLPPVNKHVVTNQKSLLRKSRLSVVDSNTLTSPEAQQVRNQPGDILLKEESILDKNVTPKSPLSLETQFFQRQQIVEELQRVEQELKEKGAGALLEGPLQPTSSAINNLLTPTTPPGPPPDSISQGMVCGSTGVFHATAQSGCSGQSLSIHGGSLPTMNTTLPPPPPLTPITTPGDVVQATAISDRPKAKPTWKKEGKIARKQAATFQQALHHSGPFFDPPAMQQFKHLVHKSDEMAAGVGGGRLVGVPGGSNTGSGNQAAGGPVVGGVPSVGNNGQDPSKPVFTTNHIVAHIKQQLDIDIASPIHIHSAHDPSSHTRSSQELSGISGQCELIPRRCPLLSQGDEQTLIDLAKAGKLDQETLESFTLDDITEVVGERLRSSPNTESFIAGMEAVAKLIVPTRPLPIVPESVSSNDQSSTPMQYLYTSVPPTTVTQPPTSSSTAQQQTPYQLPCQLPCQNDSGLPCGGGAGGVVTTTTPAVNAAAAQLPPPPSAVASALPTPNTAASVNQAQLLLKAPPPCKLNNPLSPRVKAPESSREQVQAGTQTSPAPPPEQQNKKSVITTTTSSGAVKGKKPRYPLQQKSTQAPPIHPENHIGYPGCEGQAGNGGPAAISFCMDVDSATDSNNDTALTLACAGGHEELVELLLSRGANIEHRDKKGFTPLILAATAGHEKVVEILMNHSADMEAQSERTKDTPLSLACSGGRYEVVELLLAKGANKEHRNVSDYTPLSLAASGGYVNIIKLLLTHGAEINSRTGSKLGISPLMLAAMNGHTAAVKLLLDMGSDINAQIETNRNTALTLACFQGRHEVVSLLLDRRANVEHRAKTGLTPLMEAASGGYVEVGRVLLDKGADVNAPPVPSSRDTALTIAADKGHCRFVELLLNRSAQVEVKNKKGNSPLWLAANGGHLAVVELLYNAGADIDSQDNRKVSCLMAAFRKGHVKVVKWMVNHVMQFPSDQEMTRYISTVNDKELLEKCQECTKIIRAAKDQQAAKANKNATILLEELYMEKEREESKRAAAARRRERKKKKKLEKKEEKRKLQEENQKNERYAVEDEDEEEHEEEEEKPEIKETKTKLNNVNVESVGGSESPGRGVGEGEEGDSGIDANSQGSCSSNEVKGAGRRKEKKKKKPSAPQTTQIITSSSHIAMSPSTSKLDERRTCQLNTNNNNINNNNMKSGNNNNNNNNNKNVIEKQVNEKNEIKSNNTRQQPNKSQVTKSQQPPPQQALVFEPTRHPADREDFEATGNDLYHPSKSKKSAQQYINAYEDVLSNANKGGNSTSPKQAGKRDEGWKEVVRKYLNSPFRSKKVSVPLNAISRVIGRGGSNINAIRSATGAHIEVEKQSKGQGERIITLKGSPEATKQANSLIAALIKDPDVDILQILPKSAKSAAAVWEKSVNTAKSKPGSKSQSSHSASASTATTKSTVPTAINTNPTIYSVTRNSSNPVANSRVTAPRLAAAAAKRQAAAAVACTNTKTTMSYTSAIMTSSRNSGGGNKPGIVSQTFAAKLTSEVNLAPVQSTVVICQSSLQQQQQLQQQQLQQAQQQHQPQRAQEQQQQQQHQHQQMQHQPVTNALNASVNSSGASLNSSVISSGSSMMTPANNSPTRPSSSNTPPSVASSVKNTNLPASPSPPPPPSTLQPTTSQSLSVSPAATPVSTALEYSLFNDTFTKVAQQSMWGRENDSQKGMNFASVAANGAPTSSVAMPPVSNKYLDPSPPQVDASKAPGYRGNLVCSPVSKENTPCTSNNPVSSGSNYFPPHSESLSSFRPPPPPPSAYQPTATELDHTTVPSFHPSSVAAMSRLNPRAPDFSTSLKPATAATAAAACYLQQQQQQQPPPSAPPPPLMPTNNNVISFKTVSSRPNGQTRWPFLSYAPVGDMTHLATLATMSQADLLGPLENNTTSNNVSPSSPQQQQPQQPPTDDRKIPPRPIGTERAWKNYNAINNTSQELDMNPTWMMEPKMSWPGGPQTTMDRHHLFRQTPNPVSFSRIPLPEDMQHIIDTPYQNTLDAQFNGGNVGGGMSVMHSLPAVMPHYNAVAAAAAAAAVVASSQEIGNAHPDTPWDQGARLPIQDLQPDKQHYYSASQGWTKWSH